MEQLELVIPTLDMETQALDYRKEFIDHGEPHIPGSGGFTHFDSYGDWFSVVAAKRPPTHNSFVPADTYFAVAGDYIVGTIQIRHRLNDDLLLLGGHIGYAVRPSQRWKGYATQMLAMALEKCRELGISKVLVTCDQDNAGSARTILKHGGVLENELPQDNGKMTQRYWISVM